MCVYDIIQEIGATRSRNEKESILKREFENEDLKKFFYLTNNNFINFYQKKPINIGEGVVRHPILALSDAMYVLQKVIADRQVTGNAAIAYIQNLFANLSEKDESVIKLILQKKTDCDIGTASINKTWKDLIPTFPVMLASPYSDKLVSKFDFSTPQISNVKSDGGRVAIIINEAGNVNVFSRAGNELNVFGVFDFLNGSFSNCVLDGELLTVNESGKYNPRQTSNGIFNKCVKGTLSQKEAETLHVTVWDLIPFDDFKKGLCTIPYIDRVELLTDRIPEFDTRISLIPSRMVNSIEEVQQHYQEMISAGEEGTMLKSPTFHWSDSRSKEILKLKSTFTADLEVVGFKEGEGKFAGNLGSLELATSDRKVFVSMSGFMLKLRSEIYASLTGNPVEYVMVVDGVEIVFVAEPLSEVVIGSIIEVMYNGKIKGKNNDTWSLFLPRFSSLRLDKTVANSFDELQ